MHFFKFNAQFNSLIKTFKLVLTVLLSKKSQCYEKKKW